MGSGDVILSPGVAGRVFARASADGPPSPFPELTSREREVLALMASGHNSPRIAQRLGLSPKTVRNHVSAILAKLGAADRAEAVIRAREAGLGGAAPR